MVRAIEHQRSGAAPAGDAPANVRVRGFSGSGPDGNSDPYGSREGGGWGGNRGE